ncbi:MULTISPECIES: translation initiation factor [Flavobacteriaceae]|jgi:translation initiation factor 1|uniref:Translation initiation factor n=1 Tax=Xanthomarina gelatinilytica TaxID=1137281 RepID=M7MXY8_9FLAO|nr:MULTISPECIES: translation initiation factor [Flavobacteriaceae]EMQ94339.1 Translation initiation factor SUI1-related protein [Xanthomarina gelatinilytica]MAL23466.1 translation initiation factor [Xanthomarina sp.]MBF61200.1 translation initiation factor [Xanthomarina sp.]HAB28218.1 translation initiation factor [Xanthomarina gelatinilytica]HCY82873.1 translation initiation factor [Xanthomarina gelatinilytica]|tara:strand:+ start:1526 stop:1858 length:333 start_codon:yes stop_codon:yes gene_type:complete
MDLQDQLKQLFPDHKPDPSTQEPEEETQGLWMQEDPIICKYEKRKGKPITILEGYTGATEDFKTLAKEIKTTLSVGGSFKDDKIMIQGDFRDKIMEILKDKGFQVKRVGG